MLIETVWRAAARDACGVASRAKAARAGMRAGQLGTIRAFLEVQKKTQQRFRQWSVVRRGSTRRRRRACPGLARGSHITANTAVEALPAFASCHDTSDNSAMTQDSALRVSRE